MPPGSAAGLTVDTVTGNASRHSGSSVGSNPLTGDAGADDSASANSVLSTTPLGSPLGSPQTRDAPSLSLDELFALATHHEIHNSRAVSPPVKSWSAFGGPCPA